jgi:cell fate (sporulation/competence/biofilm development) regulator YmcA (YheA/YmcA/DUF963 family)
MSLEQFKEPPMMMATASMAGTLGSIYYFHTVTESIKRDVSELSQGLLGVVQKLNELFKEDQNKTEAFVSLDKQLKALNDKVNHLPSIEHIDNVNYDVSEIMEVLSENNLLPERKSGNTGSRKGVTNNNKPRYSNEPQPRYSSNRYDTQPRHSPQKQPKAVPYDEDYNDLIQTVRSQTTPHS